MISRWEPQLSVQCLGPQTRRSSRSCRDIPASTSTSKKVLRRICQDLAKSRGNQWKPPRGFFVFSGFSLMKPLGFFSMKPSWGFPYGTIGEHLDATKGLYPFSRETITGFSIEKQVSTVCNTQNEETSGKIIGKNHQQIGFHHEASMKSYELFVMRGYTQKKSGFFLLRLQPWRSVSNKNIESRLEHGTGIRICVVQTIVVESWCWPHHFSSLQVLKVAMVPSHVCPVKPYLFAFLAWL